MARIKLGEVSSHQIMELILRTLVPNKDWPRDLSQTSLGPYISSNRFLG